IPKYVNGIDRAKLTPIDEQKCTACIQAKATRLPFGTANNRASATLERVHSDLCGPMLIPSISGARYVLTFINDYSRYATVYFLTNKSDTFDHFLKFKALQERQTGNKLKILCSDGGGEYLSNEFRDHLADNGICHETTVADTPQQNGVAERYNRTQLECTEISRDVIFDETAVLNAPPAATIIEDEYTVEAIIGERHIDGVPQYLVKWLGYPGEDTWEPESHVKESAALEKWLNNRPQANATAQTQNDLPLTFKDAILGPEVPQWQEAINDELKSLHHNISRYKARLVAKGFTRDRSKRLMTLDQSHLVN